MALLGVVVAAVLTSAIALAPRAPAAPDGAATPSAGAAAVVAPTPAPSAPPASDGTASPYVPPASEAPAEAGTPWPPPTPSQPPTVEPELLEGYQWPVRRGRLTAFFDRRETGLLVVEGERIHEGLDITTFCGDGVRAAHRGTVLHAGRRFHPFVGFDGPLDDFYARLERRHALEQLPIVVVIDDGNGYRSAYVHLSEASVRAGDEVRGGDVIGLQGATGNASGCHLHYELIRMDGAWMRVASEMRKEHLYPMHARERVDPLRVLSLDAPGAARFVPGIPPPDDPPGPG